MLQAPTRTSVLRPVPAPGRSPRTGQAIQVVLRLLREQLAMDVVHVGQYREGERRFRVVEALHHGPAAALATAPRAGALVAGKLLEAPITLPDGRVEGALCCYSPESTVPDQERQLRLLRYGARLAAQLLDHEQVLRDLARQGPDH